MWGWDGEGKEEDGEKTGNLALDPRGFQSRTLSAVYLDPLKDLTTTHKEAGNSNPSAIWIEYV